VKRENVALVVLVLVAASLLAACGGSSESGADGTAAVQVEAMTSPMVAGERVTVRVTVLRNGAVDAGYRGRVVFETDAPNALVPPPYVFDDADAGAHVFQDALSVAASGGYVLRVLATGIGSPGILAMPVEPASAAPGDDLVPRLVKVEPPVVAELATKLLLRDFDGDGDLDLVPVLHDALPKRLYRNDGNGGFIPDPVAITQDRWTDIDAGDVDGDGDVDLIVVDEVDLKGRVWVNDGMGAFKQTDEVAGEQMRFLAVGDLDGDGDPDLIRAEPSRYEIWRNDGKGAFEAADSHKTAFLACLVLADVDADGDLDLVTGHLNYGADRVWINDGNGAFTDSGQALGVRNTLALAVADLDGDGDLDLVTGEYDTAHGIWLNDGAGAFTDSGQTGAAATLSFALLDVDLDGDADIVNGAPRYLFDLWINDGAAQFTRKQDPIGTTLTVAMATGDVDGDGDLDLVRANAEVLGGFVDVVKVELVAPGGG